MGLQYHRSMSSRPVSAAAILAALFGGTGAARAAVTYDVSIDTASLAADVGDQPFALFLGLNSGGSGTDNVATFSNFAFAGGSAGGNVQTMGSGTGNLAAGVSLETAPNGSLNSFQQNFTPGRTLTFQLTTTLNEVDPTFNTPDELAVQIDDSGGLPVGTTDPDGSDSLITFTFDNPLQIATYGSDTTQTTSTGRSLAFAAPTVAPAAVPEPTTAAIAAVAAGALALRRRQRPARAG